MSYMCCKVCIYVCIVLVDIVHLPRQLLTGILSTKLHFAGYCILSSLLDDSM